MTLHNDTLTNNNENFYFSKNGLIANPNSNHNAYFHLQNQNNFNNNKFKTSKLNFIHKGNENIENIPPNHNDYYESKSQTINSISTKKDKQHQSKIENKQGKSNCAAINQSAFSNSKDPNLPLCLVNEKQIPFDFIFDIWSDLRASELLFPCYPKYNQILNAQKEISFETRAILLDWLIDVQSHFQSSNDSLFLCLALIDAYLSLKEISKQKLQLLGITAFSVACKYEEIYPPYLKDLVNITDNSFTAAEVLLMETEILTLLNFNFTFPTCFSFWQMICYQYKFSLVDLNYGCYLMEMYALHPNFNKYLPSLIALGVAYIILKSKKYERYRDLYQLINSGHNENDLKICAKEIYDFIGTFNCLSLKAVTRKYSSERFHFVAINGLKGN